MSADVQIAVGIVGVAGENFHARRATGGIAFEQNGPAKLEADRATVGDQGCIIRRRGIEEVRLAGRKSKEGASVVVEGATARAR